MEQLFHRLDWGARGGIVTFPQAIGSAMYYGERADIKISWAESAAKCFEDYGLCAPSPVAIKAREALIIGFLAVEGAAKGTFDKQTQVNFPKRLSNTKGKKMDQVKNLKKEGKQVSLLLEDIVSEIKSDFPKFAQALKDKQAERFIHLTMENIAKKIAATESGLIKVPGLGNFRVSQIEREKDGEKTTVRRVIFKMAQKKKSQK